MGYSLRLRQRWTFTLNSRNPFDTVMEPEPQFVTLVFSLQWVLAELEIIPSYLSTLFVKVFTEFISENKQLQIIFLTQRS